ncbi:MAG TPA: 4-alpha-glucanotransferase [Puia sp.]|nr:4-alpha-glucanotransferase [Puia sp.]
MSVLKIEFYLRFYTRPGQSLHITGNIEELGKNDPLKAFPMQYMNGEFWHVQLELEKWPEDPISYRYVLHTEDGKVTEEWGNDRVLQQPDRQTKEMQIVDTWNWTGEYENVFYTAPFQGILLRRKGKFRKSRTRGTVTHIFKVKAPLLRENESVCLMGNGSALRDWDKEEPVLMTPEGNWWTARLNIPKEELPITYKYGVYNTKERQLVRLEAGDDRHLHGDAHQHTLTILHDGFVHLPNNTWRGAGVAIPVFSLRTRKSMGVGEFTDLRLLIDWAVKAGLKLVQVLPVNDTTANHDWQDSYPYAAISAFALHPLYLNLEKCAGRKYADLIKPLKRRQKELNESPQVDYEAVMKIKLLTVKELYDIQKAEFEKDPDYIAFFQKNKHWLVPYAAFCYLRDKNGTPDFSKWKIHSRYDKEAIEQYVAKGSRHYGSIALQYFIQYHLHLQLREAADYAHENGIIMKGDIPIGIYRYSCDAWMEPRLYHMDQQAGAPPDNFAVKGQNWGFPTYNWEEMEKDGFSWWKRRFEQMSNYFDGFRIDHILGFFRIWSIPMDAVQGILGHFVPAIPVHRIEFDQRHIWFDHWRYTRPFINDAVLWEVFGTDVQYVKDTFLHPGENGFYALREAFDTQRKIEEHFSRLEISDFNHGIRDGLYELISNVILMEVENSGGQQFHFRIAMDRTASFRYLEWHTQQQLRDLYVNYFFQRQDDYWESEAMHKLPALKRATNMLVFGEDLGMVPRCVPNVMRQLGILSLEIQRMPKNPAREFFHPNEAPYLSVVTPSTHDMSTIRGWWEEDRGQIQRFFNQELGQWGEAPYFCEPWVNKAIVLQHLHSPAQWSIFQLQDILGMSEQFRRENPHDERINVPANPRHYWRYRMHLTLEELIREKAFNEELKEYVEHAGR